MYRSECIGKCKVLLLVGALVFNGCYSKKDKQEAATPETTQAPAQTPSTKETAQETTAPAADAASTSAARVDVDLYLEVSNGMKGFMPPPAADKEPTTFQSRLNKLISEVQDGVHVEGKRYYLAGQNAQGQPVLDSVSYATLKNTITSGIKANVLGTPLPQLLQAALENSTKRGAVSVVVSDFIHGPDPNNPGQFLSLDSDIRSSLKQAEHQNLVVAVLGEASPFFGNYYPAVKKPAVKQTLNGEEIPFYMWVIGKQSEVQTVINKVLRNLPAQQAYFGFGYPSVPFSAVLKSNIFRPAGVVYCTSRTAEVCTSVNLQPLKDEPVEFTIGLNLTDLPASMQEVKFLKQNLKLAVTGGKASIGTVIAASDEVKATPDLAKYTHFVRINVPQLTATTGSITLQLPQVQPAWITQWSTANDNNPAAAQRKTYQLNKIIDGVQALYRDKSDNVFSATMKFNKENR
ncbi:hypothetical protein [Rufibacter tibetensis]|uniref:Uncharacterized protein n=1 Tax=Rufibacter tibetensis TaxID=512763 RepID=A0A0P0CFD1_9BACT|nr:hypothetical protein [Rufibacter tibetensis]ALJ00587.1 hypothetical protein DC20_18430 [Rufibacter tibetensis]